MKALMTKIAGERFDSMDARHESLRRKGHWSASPLKAGLAGAGAAAVGGAAGHLYGERKSKLPKRYRKAVRKGNAKLIAGMSIAGGVGAAAGTHLKNKRTKKKFKGKSDKDVGKTESKHQRWADVAYAGTPGRKKKGKK